MPGKIPKKPRIKTDSVANAKGKARSQGDEPPSPRPRKMGRLAEKLDRLFANEKDNQSQFARRMGWTDTQISRWRSGGALPDAVQLLRLARQFGVDVAYLIDDGMVDRPAPALTEDERDILKTCRNLKLDNARLQQRLMDLTETQKRLADVEKSLSEGPKPLPPSRGDTGGRNNRSG